MKKRLLIPVFELMAIAFLLTPRPLTAQPSNFLALQTIVSQRLPQSQFYLSCSGIFYSLASADGKQVQVSMTNSETSQPIKDSPGYSESPLMDFLAHQKLKAATEQDAIGAVQLYHTLSRGTNFVHQKIYHAHRFADQWVVTVNHDFKTFPGNVQATLPYELTVDADSSVIQFRERAHNYLGSAEVYTNTINFVHHHEPLTIAAVYQPDALDRALQAAWKTEQQTP